MPSIRETLENWGFQLVEDMKAAIDSSISADGGGQTSKLSGSVRYEVKRTIEGYSFALKMNDYWKYVDEGVKGSKSSAKAPMSKFRFKGDNINQKAMLQFVIRRHLKFELTAGNKKKTKKIKSKTVKKAFKQRSIEQKRKQLAFVIGRSVAQKGFEPAHFFDKVFNQERLNMLTEQLKPVIKQEIIFDIKKVLGQ